VRRRLHIWVYRLVVLICAAVLLAGFTGTSFGPLARFHRLHLACTIVLYLNTLAVIVFIIWQFTKLIERDERNARRARGLCPNCGYDLRATTDRCPECSTVPKKIQSSI